MANQSDELAEEIRKKLSLHLDPKIDSLLGHVSEEIEIFRKRCRGYEIKSVIVNQIFSDIGTLSIKGVDLEYSAEIPPNQFVIVSFKGNIRYREKIIF